MNKQSSPKRKIKIAATLILPPNASAGVTFDWSNDQLIAKSFVNPDGIRAKKAGIKIGMYLATINGKSVENWTFPQICTTMKDCAKSKRILQFSAPVAIPSTTSENFPTPPIENNTEANTSHTDQYSTPSRRRRVYMETARKVYHNYRQEGLQKAVKYIIETQAIKRIIPIVKIWLARRRWAFVLKTKRARATLTLQCIARTRAAKSLLCHKKQTIETQKQKNAAIFIQSIMRSSIATKEVIYKKETKKLEKLQKQSAIILQQSTRNMLSRIAQSNRIEKEKKEKALITIQCFFRKTLAKKHYILLRKETVSSIIIQNIWRKEIAKKETIHIRKMKSINKIQKVLKRKWVSFGIMKRVALMKEEKEIERLKVLNSPKHQQHSHNDNNDDDDGDSINDDSVLFKEDSVLSNAQSSIASVIQEEDEVEGFLSPMSKSTISIDSPIPSPISPQDLQSKLDKAAQTIQKQARLHIRNRYNLSARIIAKLMLKYFNAKRAVEQSARRRRSVVLLQSWARRLRATQQVMLLSEARLADLRSLVEMQLCSSFHHPFGRISQQNSPTKLHQSPCFNNAEDIGDTTEDTKKEDDKEEEGDEDDDDGVLDYWASLNASVQPEIACLLSNRRTDKIKTWELPLTPIGPYLSHWKSDRYNEEENAN